jgi:hypothetical protein
MFDATRLLIVKIVIGDPTAGIAPKGRKPGRAKLPFQRVRDENGHFVTVYTVDAGSGTLTNDMLTVFTRSVARARRENRAIRKKLSVAAE